MNSPLTSTQTVPFYDSPYSPLPSGLSQGASKLNHSVATNLYSAKDFDLNSKPEINTNNSLEEQYVSAVIKSKENFTASYTINSPKDFRNLIIQDKKLTDRILKRMISNSKTIIKHEVFSTELPIDYITTVIYYTSIENHLVKTYNSSIKNLTIKEICDLLLEAYLKAKSETNENCIIKLIGLTDQNYKNEIQKIFYKEPENKSLYAYEKETFTDPTHKAAEITAIILLVIIILLVLYKSLFYSSSEKSIYGVRIRDINNHEFTVSEKKDVQDKVSLIDGVEEGKVVIKGRLIKFFVTFKENVSTDDMKAKFSEILNYLSDDTKTYYDLEFYSKQMQGDTMKYPVTGYKHKSKAEITFDVL